MTTNIIADTIYKGRTLVVLEEVRLTDAHDENDQPVLISTGHVRSVVNGTPQFGYSRGTDARYVLDETRRYIDAVDMAAERDAQRAAAGAYVPTTGQDFAASWKAAA